MDLTLITKKVQSDFLNALIASLESGKMKLGKSKELTKKFLALLPFKDYDSLKKKLKKFTDENMDFKIVYVNLLKSEEELKLGNLLSKVRTYIK